MAYNEKELIHEYIFGPGTSTTVDTSFVKNFSDIKKTISQEPGYIENYSEYPKGFKILIQQFPEKIVYKTNFPLKEISKDKFEIEFP